MAILSDFNIITLPIGIIFIIVGVIGQSSTIFYGTNSKITEWKKSLEFMKEVNNLMLKYKKKK